MLLFFFFFGAVYLRLLAPVLWYEGSREKAFIMQFCNIEVFIHEIVLWRRWTKTATNHLTVCSLVLISFLVASTIIGLSADAYGLLLMCHTHRLVGGLEADECGRRNAAGQLMPAGKGENHSGQTLMFWWHGENGIDEFWPENIEKVNLWIHRPHELSHIASTETTSTIMNEVIVRFCSEQSKTPLLQNWINLFAETVPALIYIYISNLRAINRIDRL